MARENREWQFYEYTLEEFGLKPWPPVDSSLQHDNKARTKKVSNDESPSNKSPRDNRHLKRIRT